MKHATGIIGEHLACCKNVVLFDISQMGLFRLRGADAQSFLEGALTNDAAQLEPGCSRYTFVCDEKLLLN